jgi:DNA-binding IscR family transcriptional regulator
VVITCPVSHSLRRLNDRINDFLGGVTLADLIRDGRDSSARDPRREFRLEFRPLSPLTKEA